MWAIQAIVRDFTYPERPVAIFGCVTTQIPTFYLNENVQGILDENHAKAIAKEILNPTRNPLIQVAADAVNVGPMCNKEHVKPAPDKFLFNVKFQSFYAKYWTPNNEHRVFHAIRYSNSGLSLWVWIDGQEKCVPIDILLKRCYYCEEWIEIINSKHYCFEYLKVRMS